MYWNCWRSGALFGWRKSLWLRMLLLLLCLMAFSLKHTEHRPSVSVELKNPHPLLQRVGKACCWLESKFLVLILTLWTKEFQMFRWKPRPGDVVLVTIDG